jgi:hypothetical protein
MVILTGLAEVRDGILVTMLSFPFNLGGGLVQ